jgi:hypothetical protein
MQHHINNSDTVLGVDEMSQWAEVDAAKHGAAAPKQQVRAKRAVFRSHRLQPCSGF